MTVKALRDAGMAQRTLALADWSDWADMVLSLQPHQDSGGTSAHITGPATWQQKIASGAYKTIPVQAG